MQNLKPFSTQSLLVDELFQRITLKGDLPGFSKAVKSVLAVMSRSDENESTDMAQMVISDVGLTQRVLKLANSSMFSVFGGGVHTVSKAIMILGTETVGHLALGLRMVDQLDASKPDTAAAREEIERAVLAGQVARGVASGTTARDTEEAVVCAMLHGLGRMMVSFYLPEYWSQVLDDSKRLGESEDVCAEKLLGIALTAIGQAVTQRWGFPAMLTESMTDVVPSEPSEPLTHTQWLAAVSSFSTTCAKAITTEASSAELDSLTHRYADMLGITAGQAREAVNSAKDQAEEDELLVASRAQQRTRRTTEGVKPVDAVVRLKRAINDLHALPPGTNISQVVSMTLEAIHTSMGFSQSVAFLRFPRERVFKPKVHFGLPVGLDVSGVEVSEAFEPDVAHLALSRNQVVHVNNATDSNMAAKLPRWWKVNFSKSNNFVVIPLIVSGTPVAFLYCGWEVTSDRNMTSLDELTALSDVKTALVGAMQSHYHRLQPA